jgi:DNA-3-methyladenine glycosylase I
MIRIGGNMENKMDKIRCKWPNLINNEIYIAYHDYEWGIPSYDDQYLFEMILLESFHCGLSWLIILKKREAFRKAFDNFDPNIIKDYSTEKIELLMENKEIVRNRAKILANIENAKAFLEIQKTYGSFSKYIWSFTNNTVVYGDFDKWVTKNDLSDNVSKDLKKRGFKFMGSVTTYSYLEAIGVMNNHSQNCFKSHGKY